MTFLGFRLPAVLLFLLGFPVFWLLWIGVYGVSPGPASPAKQIEVIIPKGSSLSSVAEILAVNKVIRNDAGFTMLAMLTGSGKKLKAGEYVFEPGRTPLEVIKQLQRGRVLYRAVTIPEGTGLAKIAEILAKDGWVDEKVFFDLSRDEELLSDYGITASSPEGYLFPDTYYLSRGQQSATQIISMMLERHFAVFDELAENSPIFPDLLSHHEVVTLASIVEKETGLAEERALVASVFLNRLARGMRLQADPTVLYSRRGGSGRISQTGLASLSAYNTYRISGLPPGPISNPGRASLEAALFPAESDYLYFVAKDDESHYFSRTLKEHNRAVARFRNRD